MGLTMILILALLLCGTALGATIEGYVAQPDGTPYTGTVTFYPLSTPTVLPPAVVGGFTNKVTPVAGYFTNDFYAGDYNVALGPTAKFRITVPDDTNTYSLTDLVTTNAYWATNTYRVLRLDSTGLVLLPSDFWTVNSNGLNAAVPAPVSVVSTATNVISTLAAGKLTYASNDARLYIHDGSTAGGLLVEKRYSAPSGRGANILRAVVNAGRAATGTETFHLNLYGDSWLEGSTGNYPTWIDLLTQKLKVSLGSKWAGYGYCPATMGPSPGKVTYPRTVPVSYSGTWVYTGISSVARGASPTHMNTTNDLATLTWTFPDAVPTKVNILYVQKPTGGTFCYSFDGGSSWSTNVATVGTDAVKTISIDSGLPVAAPWTVILMSTNMTGPESLSIAGVYHRSAANGLVVNNLGVQGATAKSYYAWANATDTWVDAYQDGLELPSDANRVVGLVSFGTNDVNDSTEAEYLTAMNALIALVGTAGSAYYANAEWCVITPCETDRSDGTYTTRVTSFFPAIVGQVIDGTGGAIVPVIDADDWFGNVDRTTMRQWLDTTGGLHLGHYGAGVFCANLIEIMGL